MLRNHFDAVVMLTWSDWHTERRSNRYHYGSRFARELPVWVVQPDLPDETSVIEPTEVDGLHVLRVHEDLASRRQAPLLSETLRSHGVHRPLLWIYNSDMDSAARALPAAARVYHATEDYFRLPGMSTNAVFTGSIAASVNAADLLVACSQGVLDSYLEHTGYSGPRLVLANGCDYEFYAPPPASIPELVERRERRTALYQGAINSRLDFRLLRELASARPDWSFELCGPVAADCPADVERLAELSNVVWHGNLGLSELREKTHRATVGLMPFVQENYITRSSLPLKAFEYVASGLPVVTVPIEALEPYPECFAFARDAEEFSRALDEVEDAAFDRGAIERRLETAAGQSYDLRFEELREELDRVQAATGSRPAFVPPVALGEQRLAAPARASRLNVLVLYDHRSMHVNAVRDHVGAFEQYSRHRIHYLSGTREVATTDVLHRYDVVIIHYSIRVCLDWHMNRELRRELGEYLGLKALFIQDEYDATEMAQQFIRECGIDVVFTCVPEDGREYVYPPRRVPGTEFVQTLTGFVPSWCERDDWTRPLEERPYWLGYRGRRLAYWYGDLAQEKLVIGERMARACARNGVPANIGVEDEDRIYGTAWHEFLASCRAVLGTESGSNVFDFTGSIKDQVERALRRSPGLTYAQVREEYLAEHEGKVRMNQVSPRVFEAIGCRSALVLFEGTYSGVVEPETHFIPLKKDFSNADSVLDRLRDLRSLQEMTERAYRDVIESGRYGFERFVEAVDVVLSQKVRHGLGECPAAMPIGSGNGAGPVESAAAGVPAYPNQPSTKPLGIAELDPPLPVTIPAPAEEPEADADADQASEPVAPPPVAPAPRSVGSAMLDVIGGTGLWQALPRSVRRPVRRVARKIVGG